MTLRFRAGDRKIFDAVRSGKKKTETRAGTLRYRNVKIGDSLTFMCGGKKFQKKVKKAEYFKTIAGLLKKHKPREINLFVSSEAELREMYRGFYKEKIKKHGIVAWTL